MERVLPCRAPTGRRHESLEVGWREALATIPDETQDTTTRMIWFVERCRQLETDKLHLHTELNETCQKLSEQTRQTKGHRKANTELKDLVAEMADKLREVEKEKRDALELAQDWEAKHAAATKTIKELTVERRKLQKKVRAVSSRQAELDMESKRTAEKHEEYVKRFDAAVEEECSKLTADMRTVRKSLADKVHREAVLERDVADLQGEVSSLQATVSELRNSLSDAETGRDTALADKAAREAELGEEIAKQAARMQELKDWANKRVSGVVSVEDEVRRMKEQLDKAESERAEAQRAVYKLQVKDEQQSDLLLRTRQRLQKANRVVIEAQKLVRLEHMASKDFKRNLVRLLKDVKEQEARAPSTT